VIACVHHEKSEFARCGTIFLEYMQDETLFSFIQAQGASSEAFSLSVFASLVDAVSHVHSKNLCHNDIKPENVMFSPSTLAVKLFDFGLSELVKPDQPLSSNCAGSPLYMAPEVYKPECHNPLHSDVWSLGIILFELLTGETPFSSCESLDDLKDYFTEEYPISLPPALSPGVQDLLSKILSYDPVQRPSSTELRGLVAELRDPKQDESQQNTDEQQPPRPRRISSSPSPRTRGDSFGLSPRRVSGFCDTDDEFCESDDSDGPCSSSA